MPSITLSSAGTAFLPTDYIGAKTTTCAVSYGSSTSSTFYILQATLDDPIRSSNPSWFMISTTTYNSSTYFDIGTIMQILTPVAGVRINSTNIGASSLTLRVLQNSGG